MSSTDIAYYGIVLRECCAMSSTDIAYGDSVGPTAVGRARHYCVSSASAHATRCFILTYAMLLSSCVRATRCPILRCHTAGLELVYAPTRKSGSASEGCPSSPS
eukprot:1703817-Rhodomonas_salina.6